jgi:hypothetical protein
MTSDILEGRTDRFMDKCVDLSPVMKLVNISNDTSGTKIRGLSGP